jgi:hypothetical protein
MDDMIFSLLLKIGIDYHRKKDWYKKPILFNYSYLYRGVLKPTLWNSTQRYQ